MAPLNNITTGMALPASAPDHPPGPLQGDVKGLEKKIDSEKDLSSLVIIMLVKNTNIGCHFLAFYCMPGTEHVLSYLIHKVGMNLSPQIRFVLIFFFGKNYFIGGAGSFRLPHPR